MNRLANPLVGSAAAQVAIHRLGNLLIAWMGRLRQQRCCRHDLSSLAIATLRNLFGNPGLLQDMQAVGSQSFNGGNAFPSDLRDRSGARPYGRALHVYRARSAKAGTTAEFRSCEFQCVAQHPKQWGFRRDTY